LTAALNTYAENLHTILASRLSYMLHLYWI